MHAWKDTHRHVTRIVTNEHLVDLEDGAEFSVKSFSRNVRQIKVDLVFTAEAKTVDTHLEDLSRCDVARHEVAVGRIFFFEKIPTLALGNRRWRSHVALLSRHPNTSTFATRRFGHQPQLVFAGNRC